MGVSIAGLIEATKYLKGAMGSLILAVPSVSFIFTSYPPHVFTTTVKPLLTRLARAVSDADVTAPHNPARCINP